MQKWSLLLRAGMAQARSSLPSPVCRDYIVDLEELALALLPPLPEGFGALDQVSWLSQVSLMATKAEPSLVDVFASWMELSKPSCRGWRPHLLASLSIRGTNL
jgi:hypothetical protein